MRYLRPFAKATKARLDRLVYVKLEPVVYTLLQCASEAVAVDFSPDLFSAATPPIWPLALQSTKGTKNDMSADVSE